MQVKINVNEYVKVKLNPLGLAIHKQCYDVLCAGMIPPYVYKAPKIDAEGYSKFPLWELMRTFGDSLALGAETPFDCELVFEKG